MRLSLLKGRKKDLKLVNKGRSKSSWLRSASALPLYARTKNNTGKSVSLSSRSRRETKEEDLQVASPEFLRKLELLKVTTKRKFWGNRQGKNISLRKGHGIEFADFREYQPGDSPRSIDWGLYARSDRLYIKTFQEERNIPVLIILDASASMWTGDIAKWHRACDLALALCYVALSERESVSLAIPGIGYYPNLSGAGAFHQALHLLTNLSEMLKNGSLSDGSQFDLQREISLIALQAKFPGVCIFISDFLYEHHDVFSAFDLLRARNLDITAIRVLGAVDLEPISIGQSARLTDAETGQELSFYFGPDQAQEYQELLNSHQTILEEYWVNAQVKHALANAQEDLLEFFADQLGELIGTRGL